MDCFQLPPHVRQILLTCLFGVGVSLLLAPHAVSAVTKTEEMAPPAQPQVSEPVTPTLSQPVRELPGALVPAQAAQPGREVNPRRTTGAERAPLEPRAGQSDPWLASQAAAPLVQDGFTTPLLNFAGQGFTGVMPPDAVGDVGPIHYIQMVNNSASSLVAIYLKATGALATPAFLLSSLAPMGSPCRTGEGDPIVLYDELAARWLLTEFSDTGNNLCVYVSQTADPIGAYYAYRFPTPNFPDYPKYAVWTDAYLVTTNDVVSINEMVPAIYALDRVQMLAGAPATSQRFTAPPLAGFEFQTLTPGDLDGQAPPAGGPGYLARQVDTEVHGPPNNPLQDFIEVWSLVVDWVTPANSLFALAATVPVAEFDSALCGLFSFSCFPQPNSGAKLDPVREVIMWRLQYRNFGTYATLVGNFVTDVDDTDHGGVRWFELRKENPAGNWTLRQEGTFAPDANNRWMGSAALDKRGNFAVGFNVVNESTYASLRYAGRRYHDPPNTLPVGEAPFAVGQSPAGSSVRYGDYNALTVDPVDGCTFWFTGEYNASSNWKTRIGTFRFDNCLAGDFELTVTPTTEDLCLPQTDTATYTITVTGLAGFARPVALTTTGAPGTASFTVNPITPGHKSRLTIQGATTGVHTFTVVATTVSTPTIQHTQLVTLSVQGVEAVTVTTTADSGMGSLRQALAAVCSDGEISFDAGLAGQTINLTSGVLAMQRNVTVVGLGRDELALTAGDVSPVLAIAQGVSSTVRGLTIRDTNRGVGAVTSSAIRNHGQLVLEDIALIGNGGSSGGALSNTGTVQLQNCLLRDNRATSTGGGIASEGGVVQISASTLADNVAGSNGGAIFGTGARIEIVNSTLDDNQAQLDGGGIFAAGGSALTIRNSTLTANTIWTTQVDRAPAAGGALTVLDATANLSNTILARGAVGANCLVSGTAVLHAGVDNLATDRSCDLAALAPATELALTALGDYGGATPTVALLPNSAAIDRGLSIACPPSDQRRVARSQGTGCDVGAYESRGFVVTLASGDSQSTTVNTRFSQSLVVTVTSPFAEPVNGGWAVFTAPNVGPSALFTPSATAKIVGQTAAVQARANHLAGAYPVAAGGRGVTAGATFGLTNLAHPYTFYLPVIQQK